MKTLEIFNVNENGVFEVSVIEDNQIKSSLLLEVTDIVELTMNDEVEVTYDSENEELEYVLKQYPIKYVEVDTFADGGNEHDLYLYKAIVHDGEVTFNNHGVFVKSYKNEKSAITFANTLCDTVIKH